MLSKSWLRLSEVWSGSLSFIQPPADESRLRTAGPEAETQGLVKLKFGVEKIDIHSNVIFWYLRIVEVACNPNNNN